MSRRITASTLLPADKMSPEAVEAAEAAAAAVAAAAAPKKKKSKKKTGASAGWGRPGDELELWDDGFEEEDDGWIEEDFQRFVKTELAEAAAGAAFHSLAEDILTEFYESADPLEVEARLEENASSILPPRFVKKAVVLSLGRKGRERELTSVLLAHLVGSVYSDDDIAQGFRLLLEETSDLTLDHPDGIDLVGYFLARAILDECMLPSFLRQVEHVKDPKGVQVLRLAASLLRMGNTGRLSHIWGPGDGRPIREVKQTIGDLLREYAESSGDVADATRGLREYDPHFHHELIKQGIVVGFIASDGDRRTMASVHKLFVHWHETAAVTPAQFIIGARRVADTIDDLKLDYPRAFQGLLIFVSEAVAAGYLRRDWVL